MAPTGPDIDPRKRPNQNRAKAMVEAILEAAARILEEEGLDAVNTNEVAERAGASIGSLYQYFPSRKAILAELIRRDRLVLKKAIASAVSNISDQSFAQVIDQLLSAAVAHQLDRPRLARALEYVEGLLPLNMETEELNSEIVDDVERLFLAQDVKDPRVAARDVVAMVKGIADAAGIAGEIEQDSLRKRLKGAVLGYLNLTDRTDKLVQQDIPS